MILVVRLARNWPSFYSSIIKGEPLPTWREFLTVVVNPPGKVMIRTEGFKRRFPKNTRSFTITEKDPTRVMTFELASQFDIYLPWLIGHLA